MSQDKNSEGTDVRGTRFLAQIDYVVNVIVIFFQNVLFTKFQIMSCGVVMFVSR